MSKYDILEKLSENTDGYLSGEKISKDLNISRSAVWKQIEALRKEGYLINSSTNGGYILCDTPDIITFYEMEKALKGRRIDAPILAFQSINSTNKYAKQLVEENAQNGTLIISNEQTLGKGRFSRTFFSPANKGIYMSLIYNLSINASNSSLVTVVAALSVCKAIEKLYNIKPTIKWTNDIYLGEKKVCGILTQATLEAETGFINSVIIGIGVNVQNEEDDFDEEIKNLATSLLSLIHI